MAYEDRKALITQVEQIRGRKVLCYILSDRESFPPNCPGLSTQMTSEPHLLFVDHLRHLREIFMGIQGGFPGLDLLLYTSGGATDSVWPLASLLQQYEYNVLVPFRAHGAGTLLCLGAKQVIMSEIGELSLIDATASNQFTPTDPNNTVDRFGISFADVASYFELCRDRRGIKERSTNKIEVLKELTQNVHPLALGNVQGVYMQIRQLARKLLNIHMGDDDPRIDPIIKALTEDVYCRVHTINKSEAIILGSRTSNQWVSPGYETLMELMLNLFDAYANTLSLREKFQLPTFMGDQQERDLELVGGFIESADKSHVFKTKMKVIQRPYITSNVSGFSRFYEYNVQEMGWVLNQQGI